MRRTLGDKKTPAVAEQGVPPPPPKKARNSRFWVKIVASIIMAIVVVGVLVFELGVNPGGEWIEVNYAGTESTMGVTTTWVFTVTGVSSPAPNTANFTCEMLNAKGQTFPTMGIYVFNSEGALVVQWTGSGWEYHDVTIAKGYSFKVMMVVYGFSVSGYSLVVHGRQGQPVSIRGNNRIS